MARPMGPVPMTPTLMVLALSMKAPCTARSALALSSCMTTALTLRPLQPWEMATMLMLERPSASKKRPLMPAVSLMPSPTAAMMVQGEMTSTGLILPSWISEPKARAAASRAASARAASMATVMLCSDDACAMSVTLMPCSFRAPKSRCATPGTPTMPAPSRFTSAMPSTVLKPQTHVSRPVVSVLVTWMRVPFASGAKVFLM
mmetsp:Transcript_14776/g.44497  ORF Transcript_14776/g.44497 Transcript_14776/m.44497 type:complete len:203 (-) Transcript_14776:59-667(-)